jgi:uncharacterized protein YjlB
MMVPVHIPWAHSHEPTEAELRQIMRAEGLEPFSWSNGSGDRYPVHSHAYHKVIYCVVGGISFALPGQGNRTVDLKPGDRLELPVGVNHGAVVGEEGVLCLEGHRISTPPDRPPAR